MLFQDKLEYLQMNDMMTEICIKIREEEMDGLEIKQAWLRADNC